MKLSYEDRLKLLPLRQSGKTFKEIARIYGISPQRVGAILGRVGRLVKYPPGYMRCYGYCKEVKKSEEFYGPKMRKCIVCLKLQSKLYMRREHVKAHYRKGGKYYIQMLARQMVNQAVKRGELVKPENCQVGKDCSGRIEGHHYLGYEREHWLDVQWYCSKHHQLADKEMHPAPTSSRPL